jgi:hypothetical protein
MKHRPGSDDDLIDFWVVKVATPEADLIMVEEGTARALLSRQSEAMETSWWRGTRCRPFMIKFMDLYGDESNLRIDTVVQIYHSSPEGRALDDRQSDLLKRETDNDSKGFDA